MDSSTPNTFTPVVFSHKVSVKLDENNFLLWRPQVLSAIRGHRLQHFISASHSPPRKFLNQEDEILNNVNPKFIDWEVQDQLLYSWLLSSMSDGILTRIVGAETSTQIWKTLEVYFVTQTSAKIDLYTTQLENCKKGSLSINEYLLSNQDSCRSSWFWLAISKPHNSTSFSQNARTRHTTDHPSIGRGSWNPYAVSNRSGASNMVPPSNSSQGRGHSSNPNSISQSQQSNLKPVCQLCSRTGHTAARCYQRFNYDFPGLGATNISKQSVIIATTDSVADQAWYPDSGATAHCTANENNLSNK
uniref:Retrotransposon Copia-like N-terminal domain-containing protein n=1 Tax=Cannabis sativa TaxID=3483 RepID=A0A803Q712_CANSA